MSIEVVGYRVIIFVDAIVTVVHVYPRLKAVTAANESRWNREQPQVSPTNYGATNTTTPKTSTHLYQERYCTILTGSECAISNNNISNYNSNNSKYYKK